MSTQLYIGLLEQSGWSPVTMLPWSLGYHAGERSQEKHRSGDIRWKERLWEGGSEALDEFLTECEWHGWSSQYGTEQKNPQAGETVSYLSCKIFGVCVSYRNRQQKHRVWALWGKQEGCLWKLTFKTSQSVLPGMPFNHTSWPGWAASAHPLWAASMSALSTPSSQHTMLLSPWVLHLFYSLLVLARSHWRQRHHSKPSKTADSRIMPATGCPYQTETQVIGFTLAKSHKVEGIGSVQLVLVVNPHIHIYNHIEESFNVILELMKIEYADPKVFHPVLALGAPKKKFYQLIDWCVCVCMCTCM